MCSFVFTVPDFAGTNRNVAGFAECFKVLNFTAEHPFVIEEFVACKSVILNLGSRGKHNLFHLCGVKFIQDVSFFSTSFSSFWMQ